MYFICSVESRGRGRLNCTRTLKQRLPRPVSRSHPHSTVSFLQSKAKLSPKSDLLLPPSALAAGTSVLQQLVEDAGLFQRPEVGDVLRDNGDALAAICLVASTVVAVG